jgi:hypothetical protein
MTACRAGEPGDELREIVGFNPNPARVRGASRRAPPTSNFHFFK